MKKISLFSSIFFLFLTLLSFLPDFLCAQPTANPRIPEAWSIVASYTIPGKASGLAYDGTYIYSGIYGANGNQVFKFNPADGTYSLQCTGPFSDAYGLSFKSPNLITINQPSNSNLPSEILEFTMAGTQVSTITLPDHYMSGVAYDNGNYWVCTYYPDNGIVYHVDASGTVLSQFVPPNSQPWDICLQGSDLWIADYYGNMLYKVTNTGTLLESHPSQGTNPAGIVFDGTYLWYTDGQYGGSTSTLYKIDLSGSGTPAIYLPLTSHDYGTVTVGNSPTWNCQVQNTGTANLVINSVTIPSGDHVTTSFVTPATITPSGSVNIPFTYSPTSPGSLNTQATINSNDPIHTETLVTLTGNAVYSGPHLTGVPTSHDWNQRRSGSYSRWFLPVTNNGDQPLIITALDFTDSHFYADEGVVLPLTIPTLQTKTIGIWFHSTEGAAYTGTLSITSNDLTQNSFAVSLAGTGVVALYPMGTVLWNYTITGSIDDSPKSIRPIPDITGDGVDDVIIASEDYNIRCLNGNSSGEADVMWTFPITAGSVYQQNGTAIIDDIDNDGYKDVIIGTTGGDESIIALSGKTGAQLWKHDTHEYGGGGWVYQVDTKYDYNNDGFPDVLACAGDDGNGTGPKRVYCLDGKTGSPIWETPCTGAVFAVIGVEDFNGDGIPDVVAGATTASQTQGRVYGINGANGAILWTYVPGGSSTWGLMQIDDITGDGIKDIASGDFAGNIYFHDATNGTRVTSVSFTGDMILRFEDMGDVNKDGFRDILVGHAGANGLIISGHDASSIWSVPLSDKSWNVTNMGDVTWDGINDAGIGTLYVDNRVYFLNGANGNTLHSETGANPIDAISSIPDIVGDHSRELVAGGRQGAVVCFSGGYDSTTISIPNKQELAASAVRIYPNPCRDQLNISLDLQKTSPVIITVTDITGRTVYSEERKNMKTGLQVIQLRKSLVTGEQGAFIVGVETDEGNYHFRVVFE